MRKILIVGAGQSGLHLAHGLLSHGYDVTVITGQTSTEIRTGRPSITQLTYPTVLEYERELHLDFWSSQAPHIEKSKLHLYPSGVPEPIQLAGHFDGYAVSVDRRVKMADWLEYFEDCGGKVVIHGVTLSDLDYFSRMFDLIVVAVGHGELGALFDTDHSRFSSARHRVLAQAHIYDVAPDPGEPESVGWVGAAEDAGMIWFFPILTAEGPCHSMFVVGKHASPMDSWQDRPSPREQWRRMQDLLQKHAPHYYERVRGAELVDGNSRLIESLNPQVRKPVGVLPSGGRVLGISDVVITSDPFAGQGWNNSTRCAKSYLESILQRGDRPFDEEFMTSMFERFWTYGRVAEQWAETISSYWEIEQPQHLQDVLGAATQYQEIADRWIQGWNNPPAYADWLFDPEGAYAYLAEVTAAHNR
ncbi:styrene monooxygenase/indole monooxygenase family protein [Nocardiopsis sediminis]|uniref:Styrene monooxygenase/indole monooxygenase family protein n=1 Tax=Nocardiopsis sediminis TaxID=1778267 RepID=A0ABV8FT58_9ACTN